MKWEYDMAYRYQISALRRVEALKISAPNYVGRVRYQARARLPWIVEMLKVKND